MKPIKYVAILTALGENIATEPSTFTSKYVTKIAEAMDYPNVHFIFSDQTVLSNYIIRYFKNRKFHAYTIYTVDGCHTQQNVKNFSSYIEVDEALLQNSSETIK